MGVFPLFSGTLCEGHGQHGTGSLGLITRRSQVQVLPPLPGKPPNSGVPLSTGSLGGVGERSGCTRPNGRSSTRTGCATSRETNSARRAESLAGTAQVSAVEAARSSGAVPEGAGAASRGHACAAVSDRAGCSPRRTSQSTLASIVASPPQRQASPDAPHDRPDRLCSDDRC